MISIKVKGNYKKVNNYFEKALNVFKLGILDKYGQMGVDILSRNTPIDSGKTSQQWSYIVEHSFDGSKIVWKNSNENEGINIALILQYGHGTGTGGYVQGTDYINPVVKEVFEQMANDIWKEVKNL